ncbi:aldehyde dehydrogenase family protein [Halobaculum magnesiiphilum]|uniref:Aldehyde dehydrogenase family protein n=1 Tax=Halobaculum magnesiiphilum TaxID=1017351 RepID=A0A8T8WIQ0_9EURY|nr:aldehyde dehydrogenase family protein [Halobaculum magnesiiphilum]QZP39762.1 aldehyde dehydrogenase family protein [Halobaculum magnesiiphilum]
MGDTADHQVYDLPQEAYGLFIDGEWRGKPNRSSPATSPATEEVIGTVTMGTEEDVSDAVVAATEAQQDLAAMTAFERAELVHELADAINSEADDLAMWLSADQGKPLTEAKIEVDLAVEMYRDAAENVKRAGGETIPAADPDTRVFTLREPHGVYGVITPWNYPLTIPSEYLAPGLGVGNAIVWVPAPTTSVFSVKLVEVLAETGLPDGALNLVTGEGPVVGEAVVKHGGTDAVGFTGSPETGELVARNAGAKPTLLELGGNGPVIVLDDADIEHAAETVAGGCFTNAGQICTASERILVHEDVHEPFREQLLEHTKEVTLGHPLSEATDMGPLNNESVAKKMDAHVEDAVSKGATLLHGGERSTQLPGNLYYQPTVLDDVTTDMVTNEAETFGPIAPIITFSDYDEAIDIANGIDLGLSCGVFTESVSKMYRFAEQIHAGLININEGSAHWETHTPVGGHSKTDSGVGRIGGQYTIDEMSQVKNVTVNIDSTPK